VVAIPKHLEWLHLVVFEAEILVHLLKVFEGGSSTTATHACVVDQLLCWGYFGELVWGHSALDLDRGLLEIVLRAKFVLHLNLFDIVY
jgi:hypothetical protein